MYSMSRTDPCESSICDLALPLREFWKFPNGNILALGSQQVSSYIMQNLRDEAAFCLGNPAAAWS